MRKRKRSAFNAVTLGVGIVLAVGLVGLLSAGPAGALPAACSASGSTVICTYTSGTNAFIVPTEVSSVDVIAIGGRGGSLAGDPPAETVHVSAAISR
jgi:hypothetical protein